MSEYGKPQYAQVEQPSGCEPPILHCPICGAKTGRVEEEKGLVIDPCEHLAFFFFPETGEFLFQSESFAEKTKDIDWEEVSYSDFPEALEKVGYDNRLLIIEMIYGGIGCGPVSMSDIYGFDFGTLKSPYLT